MQADKKEDKMIKCEIYTDRFMLTLQKISIQYYLYSKPKIFRNFRLDLPSPSASPKATNEIQPIVSFKTFLVNIHLKNHQKTELLIKNQLVLRNIF